MEFEVKKEQRSLTIWVKGRIDTTTVEELEKGIFDELSEEINNVNLDLQKLDYISSAGLRLLLMIQKRMNAQKGKFIVSNANTFVMEILSMTGFRDVLTIK